MTITRLQQLHATVVADGRVDLKETRSLEAAAGATVTAAEAKLLGDLYDGRGPRPGTTQQPYLTAGAVDQLDALFARLKLPFGTGRAAVTDGLQRFFATQDRGAPVARAPRTSSLIAVTLDDRRPIDGFREQAFVHPATQKAWLHVDGGGRGAPPARWYGPFDLKKPPVPSPSPSTPTTHLPPPPMTTELQGRISATLHDAHATATFSAQGLPGGLRVHDLGLRLLPGLPSYTVFLVDDGRPTASLDQVWLKRAGAGGQDEVAGPLTLLPFADPLADGRLTTPARASNRYYQLYYADDLRWADRGPAATTTLARGSRVIDATQYFVVPKKADGTLDDPDRATEVWFRLNNGGKWSGPHTI